MDGTSRHIPARNQGLARHGVETMRLAGPLIVALLAQMAMGVTDTVLLGGIGGDALAAGGLGTSFLITTQVVLQGVLAAVSVLVAQARGAGEDGRIPAIYWTGLLLTALLAVPAIGLFSITESLLLWAGEPPHLARDVGAYVSVLQWGAPGALLEMGMLRAFLPAIGAGSVILWATLAATLVNGVLCYGLIHGVWWLPRMGLQGAALATVIVWTGLAAVVLAALHLHPGRRRFVTWARPQPGAALGHAAAGRAGGGHLCRGNRPVPGRGAADRHAGPGGAGSAAGGAQRGFRGVHGPAGDRAGGQYPGGQLRGRRGCRPARAGPGWWRSGWAARRSWRRRW